MESTTTELFASKKRKIEASTSLSVDEGRPKKKPRHEEKMDPESFSENLSHQENQMTLETSEEPSYAPFLPPEILFKFFNASFTVPDLHAASCVCSSWNLFLKDEAFSWRLLFQDRFHMSTGSADCFTVALEQVEDKFRSTSKKKVYRKEWLMKLYSGNEKLEEANLSDMYYKSDYLSDILQSDIYEYKLLNYSVIQYNNYHPDLFQYYFRVHINFYRLEMKIRRGEQVPIDLLTSVLLGKLKTERRNKKQINFEATKSYTPEAAQIITEQPAVITGVQLHTYQIRAINWMLCRERDSAHKEYIISPLLPIGRAHMYLYATQKSHQILYLGTAEEVSKYDLKFKVKGGILADEMGLGKTVEMIGLIAANPRMEFPTTADPEEKIYRTKASLILCPNHLVAQWRSEIEKYCGKQMTVLVITTITHVKKYTSHDIIDADVVLITYNLLEGSSYFNFQCNNEGLRPLKSKGVILEQFDWHRVVCDEAHEKNQLPKFKSQYLWCMTGTPFAKEDFGPKWSAVRGYLGFTLELLNAKTQRHMSQFDTRHFTSSVSTFDHYLENKLDKILVNQFMWRNTKESIKEEYELVKTKQDYVLLNFTPLEEVIYKDICSRYKTLSIYFYNSFAAEGADLRLTDIFETRKLLAYRSVENREKSTKNVYGGSYLMDGRTKKEIEILELYLTTIPKSLDDVAENSLEWLIERFGTKTANLYLYLKDLFEKDNEARALIFSTQDPYLAVVKKVLEERGIYTSTLKGNVHQKSKEIKNFKDAESMVRVVLLNTTKVASGMNLIEASHVIFLDVATGSDGAAHESQAIGRAYRQGQTKHVTVVRFVIKGTRDFDEFENRCPNYADQSSKTSSMLVRSSSSLH